MPDPANCIWFGSGQTVRALTGLPNNPDDQISKGERALFKYKLGTFTGTCPIFVGQCPKVNVFLNRLHGTKLPKTILDNGAKK